MSEILCVEECINFCADLSQNSVEWMESVFNIEMYIVVVLMVLNAPVGKKFDMT